MKGKVGVKKMIKRGRGGKEGWKSGKEGEKWGERRRQTGKKVRREDGIEGKCMRGELQKKGEGRREGGAYCSCMRAGIGVFWEPGSFL
jgi:hypothetical protein